MTFNTDEFSTVVETQFPPLDENKNEDWFVAQIIKTVDKIFGPNVFTFQHAHYVTIVGPSTFAKSEPYEATLIVYFEKEATFLHELYIDLMKQIAYDADMTIYPTFQANTFQLIIFTEIEL